MQSAVLLQTMTNQPMEQNVGAPITAYVPVLILFSVLCH
jgi:hypothetical protein